MAATAGKRFNIIDKSDTKLGVAVRFLESIKTELTPLTILTPLAFAPRNRAKTRMNTEFCGGQTLSPTRLSGILPKNITTTQANRLVQKCITHPKVNYK